MPCDSSMVAEPIHLEDHLTSDTAPLGEALDAIAREQAGCGRLKFATTTRRRSSFAEPRLAAREADLNRLLEQLDDELASLSTRLDRALSR